MDVHFRRLRARFDHRGDHHARGDPDHGLEHPPGQRRAGDTLMTSIASTEPAVAQSQPMGLPKVNVGRIAAHVALLLLVVLWTFPTVGLLISSVRDKDQLALSGWW